MAKKSRDLAIGAAMCPDCDSIHLVIYEGNRSSWSQRVSDEGWAQLMLEVATLQKARDERKGIKPNG